MRITKAELQDLKLLAHNKQHREEKQLILLEGKRLIEEWISQGHVPECVYSVNPYSDDEVELSIDDAKKISGVENNQGYFATFHMPQYGTKISQNSVIYALHDVSDPGNLGSILRTLVWFGNDTLLLSKNSVDIFNDKVLRSAMGAHTLLKNVIYYSDDEELANIAKENKREITATIINAQAESIRDMKTENIILLFGSEAHGLGDEYLKIARNKVFIPGDAIESLNLASAVSIFAYHLSKPSHK